MKDNQCPQGAQGGEQNQLTHTQRAWYRIITHFEFGKHQGTQFTHCVLCLQQSVFPAAAFVS